MGIFGSGDKGPTKVNGIRITQSKQGYAVPVVMGQNKVQQSLIWMDGLHNVKTSSGGGKGGGKGGDEYLYTADVIAALCNGNVKSIGNVWCGQTWLSTLGTNETVTIGTPSTVYSPIFASLFAADNGVGVSNTYSSTFNDLGAPSSTTLSGSDFSPFVNVPYGTTLSSGQYSVNPNSIGTFSVTSCATASGGNTVYTGTFTGGTAPYTTGASNGFVGFAFTIAGFSNSANNGTFTCVASTTTTVTLSNTAGVSATATATATETGGSYHFSPANSGTPVVISYQFQMQEFLAQETDLITSSLAIYPGGAFGPQIDMGVVYYNNGTSLDGTALTPVTTTPTVAGTYKFTSNNSSAPKYQFASADIGKEVLISWGYQNKSAVTGATDTLLNFTLYGGTLGQSVAEYLLTGYEHNDNGQEYFNPAFPSQALGYSNTAYVLFYPMELGDSAEIQDNTFEVITYDSYGGGIPDCNPITCITNVLTNTVWGLGSGKQPFPTSVIDNGASGTWGGASGTPGSRLTGANAWNWFASQNYFISPVLDSQESASSLIGKWLEGGLCAAFISEGLFKLVPYGDTSAAGNGCTWVAPQAFVVALDDTCFIAKDGEDPVKIERSAWQDASNKTQVQFKNRSNQYADEIVQESDQAAINRYGLRLEDPQDWDFITTLNAATFAANMRLKRSVNTRNTYTFTLPFTYSYLEPMDIVTISTSSNWAAGLNNVNLAVEGMAVRITKIVDDPKIGLEITAEDYVYGANQPVIYNKGISAGAAVVNTYAQPGNSEVVMFEATSRLTQYQGNQIWIGAAGASDEWGSCNVFVSQDGTKYLNVGSITSPSRLGTLASALPLGSDPDTTDSLVVTLVDNGAPLEAGSTTDANNNNTMCYVGGEIISYSACALTGASTYTLNGYLRRGQMGSTISSHSSGALFMRIDSSILKYQYDPTWAGQTLYFKFQSVNSFGNCAQDLSTLTAVSFTVPGLNPGTVSASTGVVAATAVTYPGGATVSSLQPAQAGADKTSLNTAAAIVGQGALATVNTASLDTQVSDGTTYARVKSTALTNNTIDPSKSGVLMKGSLPPVLTNGFTYTATGTAVTWNWPANTAIYRADGTITSIGAGSQTVSGLTAGYTYYFFPVWNESSSAIQWISNSSVTFPTFTGYTGNGTSGYVSTSTSVATTTATTFSVEIWLNTTSSPVIPIFCLSAPQTIGTAGAMATQIFVNNGSAEIATATSSTASTYATLSLSSGSFTDGQTHHIVITFASGTNGVNLYKDGVLAATGTISTAMYALSGMYWKVGALQGKTSWPYTPSQYSPASTVLSNAAIYYNTILTATQVANHYQSMVNLGVSTYNSVITADAPTYWWKLNETTGTTAAATIGVNTGTYQGGTTLNQSISAMSAFGSPAIAWLTTTYLTAQASNLQGVIPITNGAISAVPTSGGSGGAGGSGGGGGGGCFSPNTKVVTKRGDIRIDEITTDDYVLTAAKTWVKVAQVLAHDWADPLLDMGNGERVTYRHSVLDGQHWEKACNLFGGSQPYSGKVWNLLTAVDEPEEISYNPITEHSYTLANGCVVHNGVSTK